MLPQLSLVNESEFHPYFYLSKEAAVCIPATFSLGRIGRLVIHEMPLF